MSRNQTPTIEIANSGDVIDFDGAVVVRNGKRVYDDLTDLGYTVADRIELWLEANPGLYPPSRIARGAKISNVNAVKYVLDWMEDHVYVVADGNGSWRKYAARRV